MLYVGFCTGGKVGFVVGFMLCGSKGNEIKSWISFVVVDEMLSVFLYYFELVKCVVVVKRNKEMLISVFGTGPES